MKNRVISFVIAFICLFSLFPPAHAAQSNSVYLIVNYPNGILRPEYDVDIHIDDTLLTTIKNGDVYSVILKELDTGTHDITLNKSLDPSITVTKPFYIDQDTTLSFEIETKKKSLEFSSVKQVTGIESSQIKIPELKYDYLDDAIFSLEKLGLKDIHYVSDNGESIKKKSDWIVISQEPSKNEIVKSTDSITLTCTNADTFLCETFIDQSVTSAKTKATQLHFNVTSYKNYITGKSMDKPDNKLTPINDWIVSSVKRVSKSGRGLVFTLKYTGTVIMPNLLNMRLSDAIEMLQGFEFSNIKYSTLDGSSISRTRNWKVVNQSLDFGDRLEAADPVILKCIEIEKGDEQVKSNVPESQYSFSECFYHHVVLYGARGSHRGDVYHYYLIDYENNLFIHLPVKKEYGKTTYDYDKYHFTINDKGEIRLKGKTLYDASDVYYKVIKTNSGVYLDYYIDGRVSRPSENAKTRLEDGITNLKKSIFFKLYPVPQLIK